jgi:hypothetical protein
MQHITAMSLILWSAADTLTPSTLVRIQVPQPLRRLTKTGVCVPEKEEPRPGGGRGSGVVPPKNRRNLGKISPSVLGAQYLYLEPGEVPSTSAI